MEDLKENTQKKIMEKLVLSAALGMFCYCSNNVTMGMTNEPIQPNAQTNNEQQHLDPSLNDTINLIQKKEETVNTLQQPEVKHTISTTLIKEKERDEECCSCCCCCEETKPVEKEQQSRKSEEIILEEKIEGTQISKIEEDKEGENETSE